MQDISKMAKAEVRLNGVRDGQILMANRIWTKMFDRLAYGTRWVRREMMDEEEESESEDG
jgi:hypothetical protein